MLGERPEHTETLVETPPLPFLKDDITSTSIANVMLIGGAVLISVYPTIALSAWVFGAFMVGHILWASRAVREARRNAASLRAGTTQPAEAERVDRTNRNLIALNLGYIALDIYAIYIRL